MRSLKLTLAYDGAAYAGWQIQPDQPTIQAALEAAQEHPDSLLQEQVERILGTSGITGLAVYGRNGRLEAWAGTHRGPVPLSVRRADAPYSFAAGPG